MAKRIEGPEWEEREKAEKEIFQLASRWMRVLFITPVSFTTGLLDNGPRSLLFAFFFHPLLLLVLLLVLLLHLLLPRLRSGERCLPRAPFYVTRMGLFVARNHNLYANNVRQKLLPRSCVSIVFCSAQGNSRKNIVAHSTYTT